MSVVVVHAGLRVDNGALQQRLQAARSMLNAAEHSMFFTLEGGFLLVVVLDVVVRTGNERLGACSASKPLCSRRRCAWHRHSCRGCGGHHLGAAWQPGVR